MKKLVFFSVIAIVFVLLSHHNAVAVVEKDEGYVSVNASSTKEVSPNQAEIVIQIETSDKSAQKASSDNKVIANNVYTSIKPLLEADDYIKTNKFTLRPQYTYSKDNKKTLDKYIAINSVVVRTKKIDVVSKLIDTAISNGATTIENLTFSSSNFESECNCVLSELAKNAYTQASAISKSINVNIVGVKSINATCNPENNSRSVYAMAMKSAVDSASATPIESGKIKIYANIDASFYVK